MSFVRMSRGMGRYFLAHSPVRKLFKGVLDVPEPMLRELRKRLYVVSELERNRTWHEMGYESRYALAASLKHVVHQMGDMRPKREQAGALWDNITRLNRPLTLADIPGSESVPSFNESERIFTGANDSDLESRFKQGGRITLFDVAEVYVAADVYGEYLGQLFLEHAKISKLEEARGGGFHRALTEYETLYASPSDFVPLPTDDQSRVITVSDLKMEMQARGPRKIVVFDGTYTPPEFLKRLKAEDKLVAVCASDIVRLRAGKPAGAKAVPFDWVINRTVNYNFPEPSTLLSPTLRSLAEAP